MNDLERMILKVVKDIEWYKTTLTVSEIVGALELIKADIIQEAREL